MKTKGTQQNKCRFCKIVLIPVKALVKAKNFYVRSMLDCSDRVGYGGIGAAPLPRSFSSRSSSSSYSNESHEDFGELVRAASGKGVLGSDKMDVELYLRKHQMKMMQKKGSSSSVGGSRKTNRRSSSCVAMGKIDEDMPCVFGEDNVVDVNMQMKYPRSKSYGLYKRSVVL